MNFVLWVFVSWVFVLWVFVLWVFVLWVFVLWVFVLWLFVFMSFYIMSLWFYKFLFLWVFVLWVFVYDFLLYESMFYEKLPVTLQGYGYNLDWRGWGTSEYCFSPNRPFHWSLISTGEGILTGSKHNTLDPVNIPSPVEIRDQWNGLFGVKQYSEVPHPLQSRL